MIMIYTQKVIVIEYDQNKQYKDIFLCRTKILWTTRRFECLHTMRSEFKTCAWRHKRWQLNQAKDLRNNQQELHSSRGSRDMDICFCWEGLC